MRAGEHDASVVGAVREQFGLLASMAIQAAILVAAERWTDEDTVRYGTVARNELQEASETYKETNRAWLDR